MNFESGKPETYAAATDEQLLNGVVNHGQDIGAALQAEFLRRHLGGLKSSIDGFNNSSSVQSTEMLRLSRWTMIVAALQIIVAIAVTGWSVHTSERINREAVARETAEETRHIGSMLMGLAWESNFARTQCKAFLAAKQQTITTLGSPVWIAQTSRIQASLSSGFFDDKEVYGLLQEWLFRLNALNERNHLMASAAVDNLSEENKAHFLKTNTELYAGDCNQLVKAIDESQFLLGLYAKKHGYDYEGGNELLSLPKKR